MLTLKIDNREHDLIKLLNAFINDSTINSKVIVKIESLDIGDLIIENDCQEEVLIIERKTVKDLAASIQDGRYNEQSLRLDSLELHNHNIIYLIEGSIDKYYNKYSRIKKEAIYSSLFSLNYFKGFSVLRSDNIVETSTLITRILYKLIKETSKTPYYSNINTITNISTNNNTNPNTNFNTNTNTTILTNDETQKSDADQITLTNITSELNTQMPQYNNQTPQYHSVVKRVKKDNITQENIGHIILSQIPGISSCISSVVMDEFGSLYDLMFTLKSNPNCLDNLTYVTKQGQERRISHKAISSIKQYLLYRKDAVISIDTDM